MYYVCTVYTYICTCVWSEVPRLTLPLFSTRFNTKFSARDTSGSGSPPILLGTFPISLQSCPSCSLCRVQRYRLYLLVMNLTNGVYRAQELPVRAYPVQLALQEYPYYVLSHVEFTIP